MPSKKASKHSSKERPRKNPNSALGGAMAPRCHRCRRAIRVPAGWSNGAATRRHYWRKHPEVMRGRSNA